MEKENITMDTTNTSVTATERYKLNKELAQMLKGGVIMDVTTPEQARIAEAAGACAVMALERIPADILLFQSFTFALSCIILTKWT